MPGAIHNAISANANMIADTASMIAATANKLSRFLLAIRKPLHAIPEFLP